MLRMGKAAKTGFVQKNVNCFYAKHTTFLVMEKAKLCNISSGPNHVLRPFNVMRTSPNQVFRPIKTLFTMNHILALYETRERFSEQQLS